MRAFGVRGGYSRRERGFSLSEVMITMTLVIMFVTVLYSSLMAVGRTQLRTNARYYATGEVADILACYREDSLPFMQALQFYGKVPVSVTEEENGNTVYLFEEKTYRITVTIVEREDSFDFVAQAFLCDSGAKIYEYYIFGGSYS